MITPGCARYSVFETHSRSKAIDNEKDSRSPHETFCWTAGAGPDLEDGIGWAILSTTRSKLECAEFSANNLGTGRKMA